MKPSNLLPIVLSAAALACSSEDSSKPSSKLPAPELSEVAGFDAANYELAEGLTLHEGKAYVGLAPTGEILEIDPSGTRKSYGHVPAGGNDGYTLGLAFDAHGDLFVLETRNSPDAKSPTPGVYRIPAGGGSTDTPFATHPDFGFPNGAAFDPLGNLLVTDSAAGRIFAVAPDGEVTTWKKAPELAGSDACPNELPFPIGANGIVATDKAVYVSNTANGSILKIDVDAQGKAGALGVVVQDCAWVGFDGIALDDDGSLIAAVNGAPGQLVRVSATGAVSVLAQSAPLDGPASVAIADDWNGTRQLLVTSSAFFSVGVAGSTPAPGLLAFGPLK